MAALEMDQEYTNTIQFQMIAARVSQHLLATITFLNQGQDHLFHFQSGV